MLYGLAAVEHVLVCDARAERAQGVVHLPRLLSPFGTLPNIGRGQASPSETDRQVLKLLLAILLATLVLVRMQASLLHWNFELG